MVHIGHMAPRTPKPAHVAHFLREHREAAGLTQEQVGAGVAAILGKENIAKEQVSRWERGERAPRPDALRALAQMYNCTVNELYSPPNRRIPQDHKSIDEMLISAEADERLWRAAQNVIEGLIRSR